MTIKRTAAAAVLASSLTLVAQPAEMIQAPGCEGAPVAVVAQVLHLGPDQVHAFAQLLQARQATLGPILQEIALREQRIRELVAGGGDPAEIGVLVVQIHQLRQAAEATQTQFLASFAGLLNEAQQRTWQQVRAAARLQPVVPAFAALQVL